MDEVVRGGSRGDTGFDVRCVTWHRGGKCSPNYALYTRRR